MKKISGVDRFDACTGLECMGALQDDRQREIAALKIGAINEGGWNGLAGENVGASVLRVATFGQVAVSRSVAGEHSR
jgi:hypothetical protein